MIKFSKSFTEYEFVNSCTRARRTWKSLYRPGGGLVGGISVFGGGGGGGMSVSGGGVPE